MSPGHWLNVGGSVSTINTIEKQIITEVKVPNKFFGTRDFPYLKLGIRDFK